LAVGRDVLRFGATPTRPSGAALVVANPDFDLGKRGEHIKTQAEAPRGRRSRDFDRARYHFNPLPGTKVEGEAVARLLSVQPWLDKACLEGPLKASRSPRILHLATHGFF